MPGPFTPASVVGMPAWDGISDPNGNFASLSSTGQAILSGGYGLGSYGGGGYGTGDDTTKAKSTEIVTIWTPFTNK